MNINYTFEDYEHNNLFIFSKFIRNIEAAFKIPKECVFENYDHKL